MSAVELSEAELSDVRDALSSKAGRLGEALETLAETIRVLGEGGSVAMFPRGEAGVRLARDMYRDMAAHRGRLLSLAERMYAEDEGGEEW